MYDNGFCKVTAAFPALFAYSFMVAPRVPDATTLGFRGTSTHIREPSYAVLNAPFQPRDVPAPLKHTQNSTISAANPFKTIFSPKSPDKQAVVPMPPEVVAAMPGSRPGEMDDAKPNLPQPQAPSERPYTDHSMVPPQWKTGLCPDCDVQGYYNSAMRGQA